ncbi:MAG: hypothetical protein K8H88_09470 [Sandaracinaceae bacterium]|nr:hypothetical protein [Sandaracinaceae bacterium]
MTAANLVVRGATVALTRRTNYRKAFLAPWDSRVGDAWLYCLALAQQKTGVAIHQSTLVINHHHTEITATDENLPVFTRLLHGEFSKALNTLMALERYDQPHQVWDERGTHTMRLVDAEAQAAHLTYSHVNPVAAGLVRTLGEMPGWTFDYGMWKGGVIRVRRPPFYFDPEVYPEWLPLWLTAVPLMYLAFDGDLDALVHHMRKLAEDATRQLHAARNGRPVMGAKALRRIHPWNEPRTMREPGGDRVPTFKVGASGLTAKRWEIQACRETTQFRQEYREARLKWVAGEDVELPYGTYLLRVQYGARVAEPDPDAVVGAPGPTLDEVREQLAARRGESMAREALLEPVREAFREEAQDVVEVEQLDLEGASTSSSVGVPGSVSADVEKSPRRTGRVRHRFSRDATDLDRAGSQGAARLTVLRDRRRGRPKSTDPPV